MIDKHLNSQLNRIQEGVKSEYTITLECTDQAVEELIPLLKHLQHATAIGHSLEIQTDPDIKEYTKKFFLDGDGASHIKTIKLNGKKVK